MNLLSSKEVQKRTGLSSVTIWRQERAGEFPERVNITPSRVGWIEEEIDEWIASRPRGICNREIGKEKACDLQID
jgi:prophage regulatory protein